MPAPQPQSESSDNCDTDKTEWLDDTFYQHAHTVSNLEYAKLKLSSFAVNLNDFDSIIVLIDTEAMCSLISYQHFMKIGK